MGKKEERRKTYLKDLMTNDLNTCVGQLGKKQWLSGLSGKHNLHVTRILCRHYCYNRFSTSCSLNFYVMNKLYLYE